MLYDIEYMVYSLWHMRVFTNQGLRYRPKMVGLFFTRAPTQRTSKFVETSKWIANACKRKANP